ncbi:MAG TPA: proton-conducting transporter membrane subunit [Pirellulales bacterium]|nr:proton-conducting transporter membrane subunit [Pirellulales bacterium]
MAVWLILCPLLAAAVVFATPSNRWRPWLVPLAGAIQLGLVAAALDQGEVSAFGGWLSLDPLSKLFLGFNALFFVLCSLYAPPYLALRQERPNRVFCACLLLAQAMMTLIVLSHHLGVMWVAMEATTLATAPGIYFNHNRRSLEATWKYLVICSVGIALALLGSFFLAYSSLHAGLEATLLFDDLVREAPHLSLPWLHAAFVLLFVGYGTKMGLAPMHTWKPDAYGEAPGLLGALMAGSLTSCAFLAILRFYQIAAVAHDLPFVQRIMMLIGMFSMALGAVFMIRQRDVKRLLAYSSVEHMGILVFGIGVGGTAVLGSLLHVVHNGLTKGVLFLSAANIHRAYGSKFTDDLHGVLRRLPLSGAMFLAGFFAITASPPFAPFVSEFQILSATFVTGHYWAGGLFVLLLFMVFIGMGVTVVSMSFGSPSAEAAPAGFQDSIGTGLPILLCMALVLLLGLYNPPPFVALLNDAVRALEQPG